MSGRFKKASGDLPPAQACLEMALGERLWQEVMETMNSAWWGRLRGVNQQLLSAYGLPLPSLRIDRATELEPNAYRFRLAGGGWEQGLLYPGRWFATGEAETISMLMGEWGQEPVYCLEGRWIPESRAEGARQLGCHLLGPEALWVGHLCDRVENRLHLCLNEHWLQLRLKFLGLKSPGPGLAQILRWLLEERATIANLDLIIEAYQSVPREASKRLRAVRRALGPRLATPWLSDEHSLVALTLADSTAKKLRRELTRPDGPEQWFLGLFLNQLREELEWALEYYGTVVLVVSGDLRRDLFELLPFELRRTPVLAFDEIPPDAELESAGVIGSRLHPLAATWPRLRANVNAL